jgi:hypothetical protein
MKTYKRQIQEEGLDKSSTYCTGDYKKPVGNVTEQITRVKTKCTLLFDVNFKTVCEQSFKERYNTAFNQKSTLEELLENNGVYKTTTTCLEINKRCFSNRAPSALTKILLSVEDITTSSTPATTSSTPAAASTFTTAMFYLEWTQQSNGNSNERLVTATVITSMASKYLVTLL